MKHNFELPPIMRHLKLDDRGYPIPFFIPIVNGKPNFVYMDHKKQQLCIDKKLCAICGRKLYHKSFWFISGPMGLINGTSSDTAMHEDCARFSLRVCPHLLLLRAERRSVDNGTSPIIKEKPSEIFLVRADKFTTVLFNGHTVIKYRHVYNERYHYVNGKLVRATEEKEFVSSHNLAFEIAPWEHSEWNEPGYNFARFKVGTCHGLYGTNLDSYVILAVANDEPGNGHFEDVLEWFDNSCKRDKKNLMFMEILNQNFFTHLITKRGFVEKLPWRSDAPDVIKYYKT